MTPKGHRVIRGRRDLLYDPKGHGDLCYRFDPVYDPKGHRVIRGRRDLLYDPKVTVTCGTFDLVYDPYFMTAKFTVTFGIGLTLFMTQKGYWVIRGHRDLLYDPKGHGDLCG